MDPSRGINVEKGLALGNFDIGSIAYEYTAGSDIRYDGVADKSRFDLYAATIIMP